MPANRQTVPRETRVAEIVAAARDELLESGFDAATMASIARRAGMTAANVHYYFATKESLAAEVLRTAYEGLFAALDAVDDPLERLRRYVRFHIVNHPTRGEVQTLAARSPGVAEVIARRDEWVAKAVAVLVLDELDAAALTAVVTGLIEVTAFHPEPERVLDHAAARLVSIRRLRP
jgi:AcrR family transcriptional regulator